MQSFLQYRRFGKAVEREHERNKEKAAVIASGRARRSSSSGTSKSSRQSQSRRDDASPATERSTPQSRAPSPDTDPEKADAYREKPAEPQEHGVHLPEGCYIADAATLRAEGGEMYELHSQRSRYAESEGRTIPADRYSAEQTQPPHFAPLSAATTQSQTQPTGADSAALGHALTGVHVRDRTTREGQKGETVFVVGYQGDDDPLNPHNWGYGVRIWATALIAMIGFVVGVASAIDSSALPQAAADFHVSQVVEILATGLYLVGFGAGSLFAGPFSETLGRNPVYIVTLSLYMVFIMASGLAPNIGAQLAFRFLAGFFGSTPLVCAGGSISDLWNPLERVVAFPVFANAAFTGPVLGPVMGGFIAQSAVLHTWRWTEWITLIMSGLVLALVVLTQPETYPITLLRWRAAHLRRVTGDDRFRAEAEIRQEGFFIRLKRALYRPFVLTISEPIIALFALYLTVLYIILFTFLDGYTDIFQEVHGISQGLTGLCFAGIAVGLCLATVQVPLIYRWAKRDLQRVREKGGERLPPEFRLWYAMLGGALAIPVSLFWMGWTSYSWISIWSPLASSVLFGYGVLCVFISCYQYIIDSYEVYSASALASVTLLRYVAAGGMTVVGIPFYNNMGVHWTLTILGSISALLVPVPYIFYAYGRKIRTRSKYAISAG